jgi:thiamine-phosphate pyrophosphorylase
MAENCLLYYITDRTAFLGDESSRRRRLLGKIAEAVRAGVDYVQLREKDLSSRELESLARDVVRVVREARKPAIENRKLETALLINSRTDVALAVQAGGVHLRSDDISPQEVRAVWKKCGASSYAAGTPFDKLRACPEPAERAGSTRQLLPQDPLVAVSCHSPAKVAQAAASGAAFAIFAPVFEKKDAPDIQPTGLVILEQACQTNIPVLALGGITLDNAHSCLEAGAAGIAAIRLFQENNIAEVVKCLRQKS